MAEEKIKPEKEESLKEAVQEENISEQPETEAQQGEKATEPTAAEIPHEEESGEKEAKKHTSKKDKKDKIIEELAVKLDQLSDKHLRLQAEFDNFRRRTMKEKAELIKSGGESVLVNILPVVDDFERALLSMKDVADEDAGKQGTILIYNKFREFLKQNNVKEIDALNRDFDVDLHEAITKIPAPEENQKGKVVDVVQKGYLLNEKVIRFAKVVIGE